MLAKCACRNRLQQWVQAHGRSDSSEHVFWGTLKEFSDGSLGSGTALMHQPYTNDASTSGLATVHFDQLADAIEEASRACLQVWLMPSGCFHRLDASSAVDVAN